MYFPNCIRTVLSRNALSQLHFPNSINICKLFKPHLVYHYVLLRWMGLFGHKSVYRLLKKEYVQLNGVFYAISRNSHPECERVRINLEKIDGVEKWELFGMCPNKYRHFLPPQRR